MVPSKKLVIGVPTVARAHDYLHETVGALLPLLRSDVSVELVVLNAHDPPDDHASAVRLAREHADLVARDRLCFIENRGGHALLAQLPPPARAPKYWAWARKQTLDCALLLESCAARGELYLHLEDDTVAGEGWFESFVAWKRAHFDDDDAWDLLCLYHPHAWPDRKRYRLVDFYMCTGLLLHAARLPALAAYLRHRCTEAPVDWLIRDFLIETGARAFVRTPCLFQHVGVVSSLAERTQLIEAQSFDEPWLRRQARLASALVTLLRVRPRGAVSLVRARVTARLRKWRRS